MKTNIHRLKVIMYDRGETMISISEKLHIDRSTFARWLRNEFRSAPLGRVYDIIEILNIGSDEVAEIFFNKDNDEKR